MVYAIIYMILFFPSSTYAYLDPGTGSALVATFFGLVGSFIFFLKKYYYLFIKKKKIDSRASLAIFSEGKIYYSSYVLLLKELISRKINFVYYTMDLEDPALDLIDYSDPDFPVNTAKIQYVGKGNKGYSAISNIRESILLTTTPHIGTPGYPIRRSKHVKNMVHFFHAVGGVAGYGKNSLDNYDSVILSHSIFEKDIRTLEKIRGLSEKKIYVGGLPYIDYLISKSNNYDSSTDSKTVLIASTWNERGCLRLYGKKLITLLLDNGYNVIVRPHPFSYIYELDFINQLKDELKDCNVIIDDNVDSLSSMAKSDIMISDISGVRFDYNLIFNRPVISLTQNNHSDKYEYADLPEYCDEILSSRIGINLSHNEVYDKIISNVDKMIGSKFVSADINSNTGDSVTVIVDILESMIKDIEK